MAKKRVKKTVIADQMMEMPVEQIPGQWGQRLVSFFDEYDVGMDAVWHGREIDQDDIDYYSFMSGYEVYSLFPGLVAGVSGSGETLKGVADFLKSKRGLSSFAHLYTGSGSFRYALPHEGDLT